ncbi:MAG: GTP-binding protein [Promethearchaeota archaeon]
MVEEYDYLFKCIVVGDGGVGKTALTIRFSKDFFTEDYKMTIGVDFHVKTITLETDEGPLRTKLQIWDTGGQERFSSIRPMYYKGSLGGLLIFDLTSSESFEHLTQWIEEVRANVEKEIPLLLVGNKSDLVEQREISIKEINRFTEAFNLYYMETSAKTGDGVGDCFYILTCLMFGSGIPEQLIKSKAVYSPGNILITAPKLEPIPEPSINLEKLPVFESIMEKKEQPAPEFEPEPEIKFEAPPVPKQIIEKIEEPAPKFEPEPEIKFEAPPVPKQIIEKIEEPAPKFDPVIPLPGQKSKEIIKEPVEFQFKTPAEILTEENNIKEQKPVFSPLPESSKPLESEKYKPKTVPFSSNVPIPAPQPDGFQTPQGTKIIESSSKKVAPFILTRTQEPLRSESSLASSENSSIYQAPYSQTSEPDLESESLVDYLSETGVSKKDRKKVLKQKKKEEKEKAKLEKEKKIQEAKEKAKLEKEKKIQEAKEKAKLEKEKKIQEAKEKAQLKKKKKEKIKEIESKPFVPFQQISSTPKDSTPPSLFNTLTKKSEESVQSRNSSFTPFTGAEKQEDQEPSKLRIIPNVETDIEIKSSNFTEMPSTSIIEKQEQDQKKKEIIICKQCGAILSSDYTYCNKCGSKL